MLSKMTSDMQSTISDLRGELASVQIDESLMQPGDSEMLADLIVLAHADAKRKLDEQQQAMMQQVAGPLAGMGLPGMKF